MNWVEEYNDSTYTPVQPRARRTYRKRKHEFVGWGSWKLIEFLELVGKDTSRQIDKDDVVPIITAYAHENKLIDPKNKRKIISDETLKALFGRKTLILKRISNLLTKHYQENEDSSDDGDSGSSGGDNSSCRRTRSTAGRRPLNKRVVETPTSPFAAVVPDNLKLVYLKKSLVQDLTKDIDTFERKVIGSFVRVKTDPNDYLQKHPYQLLQVTGVKNASAGVDISSKVILRVTVRDVRIVLLSDESFKEEECEELRQKIKDGVYKRLTIVEMEQKIRELHEDITKHWLAKELVMLQIRIEHANEKGWRRELAEYLDKKKRLENPEEQFRMLNELPKVIPESIKDDLPEDDFPEDDIDSVGSLGSADGDSPDFKSPDVLSNGAATDWVMDVAGDKRKRVRENQSNGEGNASLKLNFSGGTEVAAKQKQEESIMIDFSGGRLGNAGSSSALNGAMFGSIGSRTGNTPTEHEKKQTMENGINGREKTESFGLNKDFSASASSCQVIDFNSVTPGVNRVSASLNGGKMSTAPAGGANAAGEKKAASQVIDLSSDDEAGETVKHPSPPLPENNRNKKSLAFSRESCLWYYKDPRGYQQGPFSLDMLKLWRDGNYFQSDFKVWMEGQDPSEAVLLADILRCVFPL